MPTISRRVIISGLVQGVWFRYYTRGAAEEAGVSGWVRNLPDGRVEALFEGEKDKVDSVVAWCWDGSPSSRVENVEVIEEKPTGRYSGFEITYF